jgi:SAM-dependent methyltransferase
MNALSAQFLSDYAAHRAAEGRGYSGAALRALPYLKTGPFAEQWAVRAKSFDAFVQHVVRPMARIHVGPLKVLDLGAGNGWLCHRLAQLGHKAIALDIRDDDVDGLAAASEFSKGIPNLFECVRASFDDLPFEIARFDIAVFNASLHYARDLHLVLQEAARVIRRGGLLVILDSPFYDNEAGGAAMVTEKQAQSAAYFGMRANTLLAPNFIEFLTRDRLAAAAPNLAWSRKRVLYPLWYELRPLMARLRGKRAPSRFDLWMARVP